MVAVKISADITIFGQFWKQKNGSKIVIGRYSDYANIGNN